MKKDAKTMFKELGYDYHEDYDFIYYSTINKPVTYEISFCKEHECVEISTSIDGQPHYFARLDADLLNAINQQFKELKWK